MKNPLFPMLGITAALAALLTLPQAASAQASGTAATSPSPPVQVQVNVEYVTTNWPDFLDESARIGPGKDHDILLMAALFKDGARRMRSAQLTTTDGGQLRGDLVTPLPAPLPPLTSFIQVKPRINKNGTITVTMTNHLESVSPRKPAGAILPSTEMSEVTDTRTFMDGQTLMVSNFSSENGYSLIFARVKTVPIGPRSVAVVQPPHSH